MANISHDRAQAVVLSDGINPIAILDTAISSTKLIIGELDRQGRSNGSGKGNDVSPASAGFFLSATA